MCGIILDPVDTGRLRISNVGNVVNMAFEMISEINRLFVRIHYTLRKNKPLQRCLEKEEKGNKEYWIESRSTLDSPCYPVPPSQS